MMLEGPTIETPAEAALPETLRAETGVVTERSAGGTFYAVQVAEPSRRMDPDKEMARQLFAKAYGLDPMFQPVWGSKRTE